MFDLTSPVGRTVTLASPLVLNSSETGTNAFGRFAWITGVLTSFFDSKIRFFLICTIQNVFNTYLNLNILVLP